MKTIKLPYSIEDDSFYDNLRVLQKEQSACYRSAYKLVMNGLTEQQIRNDLKSKFSKMDSWNKDSAIKKAIGQFKTDFELNKLNPKIPLGKRIFGGKRNFIRRLKGLISKEEYQENRIENLYLIGQSTYKGNRKFDFNTDSITFKPQRNIHFELKLPNLRGKYLKEYLSLIEASENKLLPITIALNKEFIFILFFQT